MLRAGLAPERLKNTPGDATTVAHFDAALTVSAMRYISDLHIGRVNPKHFKFGIDVAQRSTICHSFSTEAPRGKQCAGGTERGRTAILRLSANRVALQTYLALADKDHGPPLPEVQKTLAPGDAYPGAEALAQRLQLLGDLPRAAVMPSQGSTRVRWSTG